MLKKPQLSFVIIGDTLDNRVCDVAAQSDIKKALLQGGIWTVTRDIRIKGLSMILSASREAAHIVAVRDGVFIAEGAIVSRNPSFAVDTFRELLGHDSDGGWFEELERRNQIVSGLETLRPPFCLLVWKMKAADRLSEDEFADLIAELQRVASGLTYELLKETSGL